MALSSLLNILVFMCPLGAGNSHFCAVGLDRFLRVWSLGAGGRRPVHKMYLKSRLNCVLMCKHFDPDKEQEAMLVTTGGKVVMILDSGCRRSVAGRSWHEKMQEEMP